MATLLCAGCGNKGALYLPDESASPPAADSVVEQDPEVADPDEEEPR